jgi:alpha-glucosidase
VFDEGVAHDYFQKHADGSLYVGEVWPGKSVFVDYTKADARTWWGQLHQAYTDVGLAGIWNDMNEPADFTDQTGGTWADVVCDDRGTQSRHDKNRNVFALLEAQATYDGMLALKPQERPFIVTRAGFSGIQRYASVWTGDNNSTWDHLALTIPMFTSMGLSGVSFVGADIGGFMARGSGELLARWYQSAFLSPFCRNHKCVDSYDQEPWRFGSMYEDIIRRYLKLRYRLLPYLYTCMEESSRTGMPVLRPLVLQYQGDDNTYNLDDEFMVGSDLLLAPVLQEGADRRRVYLPKGWWYDFWTDRVVEGPTLLSVDAPLDVCPIFVRGGAILPTGPDQQHTGEKPLDPLSWRVYPDADGHAVGTLYEDEGQGFDYRQGAFRRSKLTCHASEAGYRLALEVQKDGYTPPRRWSEVLLPSSATVLELRLNDEPQPSSQGTSFQEPSGSFHLTIKSMV